jgi:ribosomal protein L12E/L44/L45/RPP1/RPP2
MKKTLALAAALALTGSGFAAHAQGTKPMAKDGKMEAKSEEKMETKKEEKMETAKGNKMLHHSTKMHHAKMTSKSKM